MTTAIINRSSSLLSLAREKAEDLNVNEILGNACVITTLLPLVLAHIGPLATSKLLRFCLIAFVLWRRY